MSVVQFTIPWTDTGEAEDLPAGWMLARLDQVCTKIQDGTHHSPKQQSVHGTYKYITAKNIRPWGLDITDVTYVSESVHRPIFQRCNPERGDVLYIKDGATAGLAAVNPLDEEFSLLSSVALLKPDRRILHEEYLKWYLNSPIGFKSLTDQLTGSAITRIILKTIRSSIIPVPPPPEQRRIVARLNRLMPALDATKRRLAKVPSLLKRFRQSVLAAACSGRLTADYRERVNVEPAQVLLEHVERDRSQSRRSAGRKKTALPVPVDRTSLPELPYTWAWATLDEIGQEGRPIIYGIIKPGPHDPNGVPYVRVTEMKDGTIDVASLRRASKERAAKFARATLAPGDLLISKDGTIGRVATVPTELEGGNITQHLVRAAVHPMINRRYVSLAIRSPEIQEWLTGEKKGAALQGVNVEDFRRLPIPIPPATEQHEIVRRVEALFKLADAAERRVAAASAKADRITAAVLAKAFRGELAPTEAEVARREGRDYESAATLLERIRAAKTSASAASGGRRRSGRRQGVQ